MSFKRKSSRSRSPGPAVMADAQRLLNLLHALGSTTFRQLLWQRSAELDLTYAQSQMLCYVAEHPGCHVSDVAKAFGVTLPAVTHIVDRLERKKFAVRNTDPVDRRASVLELTAAGRTLAAELQTLQLRGIAPVLERMSARDRRRVLMGLEALAEAAADASTAEARGGGPRDADG